MSRSVEHTLKELLLTDEARFSIPLPVRGQHRRRTVRQPED
jgi:hypothetical protein